MFSGKSQFGMDKALGVVKYRAAKRARVARLANAESAILPENGAMQAGKIRWGMFSGRNSVAWPLEKWSSRLRAELHLT